MDGGTHTDVRVALCSAACSMKRAGFDFRPFHDYVPVRKMGQREGLRAQSFGKTEDDAKVLAHQIAGHTHTKENHEEPFCYTETRIDAVQKSFAEPDGSVAEATEIRRKQHPELVALITDVAGATELLKLAANRLR